jgi:negative regulator of flagellin synthesis FlgM
MSEINNIKSLVQPDLGSSRNTSVRDNQQNAKTVNTDRSDTVSLTSAAEQIQSLQQVVSDSPIVDADRVASLKAAIADGSYVVDSAKVAQNLLNLEFQLR